jgi:hypothetical protein
MVRRRVTLRSSSKVVVWRARCWWCSVNVDGKKKVMKKQRRSKERVERGK